MNHGIFRSSTRARKPVKGKKAIQTMSLVSSRTDSESSENGSGNASDVNDKDEKSFDFVRNDLIKRQSSSVIQFLCFKLLSGNYYLLDITKGNLNID